MRQSQLFTKTRKEAPKDEASKNAQLLIRGGFIHKEMAGVYAYLPLGLSVLKRIEGIIREEMNAIGGQELLMTTLQGSSLWERTGRWDDSVVDNWFKTTLVNGSTLGIANTHEEPITQMLTHFVSSYKDLPVYVYQFQTKFRNELRAKSGIMRGREFLMKDLYSFSASEEDFRTFYEQCAAAYQKIFNRLGIGSQTYRTVAAGGAFTTGLTDEFQTLSRSGEDIIFIDDEKNCAINKEVLTDENLATFGLSRDRLREEKSVEVGNIFPLGSKYSDELGLTFVDDAGKKRSIIMGSYGIGLGRSMGAIVEIFADEKGIIWPVTVAPYTVHILELGTGEGVRDFAEELYGTLRDQQDIEVLWDDRSVQPGEKFADADLIGVPLQVIVSERNLSGGEVEIKDRATGKAVLVNEAQVGAEIDRMLTEKKRSYV